MRFLAATCISPVTVILVGMSSIIEGSWERPCSNKFAKSLLLRSGKESDIGLAALALLRWDMLMWRQPGQRGLWPSCRVNVKYRVLLSGQHLLF